MKSLAFIVVGLTVGVLITLILLNSGFTANSKKTPPISAIPLIPSSPNALASPSGTVVEGGGKLSFAKYSLNLPNGWSSTRESPYADAETLTLLNGDYKITITQSASGGSVCVYPGDPDPGIPFKSDYKYFKEMKTQDGTVLRRSGDTANSQNFTVCNFGSENFQLPTIYGHVGITTAAVASGAKLDEIDQILMSLKKI